VTPERITWGEFSANELVAILRNAFASPSAKEQNLLRDNMPKQSTIAYMRSKERRTVALFDIPEMEFVTSDPWRHGSLRLASFHP
jgi:hypothetical protein